MDAQKSAYRKGFDAGLKGATIDETPYRDHTAGFHRGLANQWRSGCGDGDIAATMLKGALAKRDKATDLEMQGDSAMAREDYAVANDLWFRAAAMLREAAGDLKYHTNLMKRRENPE